MTDFVSLAGDRKFGDDDAIVGGFGRFRGESICIIGHEKGSSTESRLKHNFGMARPEGYRKAERLMQMADRFGIPVLSLVDTAGAYPGIGAEERGQAEAIARSTDTSLELGVPNVAVIIGEGGSGGAIAIATANRVLMLEHAIYSVISPEGAASILWRDTAKAQEAATGMKITADDMMRFGVIDRIVTEPPGGAHRDPAAAIAAAGEAIADALARACRARPRDRAPAAPGEIPGHRAVVRVTTLASPERQKALSFHHWSSWRRRTDTPYDRSFAIGTGRPSGRFRSALSAGKPLFSKESRRCDSSASALILPKSWPSVPALPSPLGGCWADLGLACRYEFTLRSPSACSIGYPPRLAAGIPSG